jgi:hypothetical protein
VTGLQEVTDEVASDESGTAGYEGTKGRHSMRLDEATGREALRLAQTMHQQVDKDRGQR